MYRVYLDTCCLNRPFDDQSQQRVRAETAAIEWVLAQAASEACTMVAGGALRIEAQRIRNTEQRLDVLALLEAAAVHVEIGAREAARAEALSAEGFTRFDALHIACAESAECDALLTTDDPMLRRAHRLRERIRVAVLNPVTWLNQIGAP